MKKLSLVFAALCSLVFFGGCHATSNMFGPGPELFGGTNYNTHVVKHTRMYWCADHEVDVVGSYADTIPSLALDLVPGMFIVPIRWLFEGKPSAVVKNPLVTLVVSSDGNQIYMNNGFTTVRISVDETVEELRRAHPGKSEEELRAMASKKIEAMLGQ